MARKKRLALALPDEADAVLIDLSEALGKSKTTVVTEILMESLPTLKLVAQALKQAKEGLDDTAMAALAIALKDAGFKIDQVQSDFFALERKKRNESV